MFRPNFASNQGARSQALQSSKQPLQQRTSAEELGQSIAAGCRMAVPMFPVEIGIDVTPVRAQIEDCVRRFRREVWDVLCAQVLRESGGGGGGGGSAGGDCGGGDCGGGDCGLGKAAESAAAALTAETAARKATDEFDNANANNWVPPPPPPPMPPPTAATPRRPSARRRTSVVGHSRTRRARTNSVEGVADNYDLRTADSRGSNSEDYKSVGCVERGFVPIFCGDWAAARSWDQGEPDRRA